MRRKIAIASASLIVLFILAAPAFLTSEVRTRAPSRTHTESPHPATFPERPTLTVWFPPGDMHKPSEGLSEPRKDRP